MPIGSIHKTGNSFRGAVEYVLSQGRYKDDNEKKKPSIVLKYNLLFDDAQQLGMEFRNLANFNKKVKKPVFHFSINFEKHTLESPKRQLTFVKKVLDLMEIRSENHQALVAQHHDKHSHYHVILNRVGMDGITYSDKFSKNRLELCIDRAEKELKMDNSLAEVRRFTYDPDSENEKGYQFKKVESKHKGKTIVKVSKSKKLGINKKKNELKACILKVLTSGVVSAEELKEELLKLDVNFDFSYNIRGLAKTSFRYDGYAIKGSALELSAKIIENQLLENQRAKLDKLKKSHIKGLIMNTALAVSHVNNQFEKGIQIDSTIYESVKDLIDNKGDNLSILAHEEIKMMIEENELRFNEEKIQYQIKLEQYQEVQNEKPQKIFGLFETIKQKEYNKELELRKQQSQPVFLFKSDLDENFKNKIHRPLNEVSNELNEKITIQFISELEYFRRLKKYQEQLLLRFISQLSKNLKVDYEFIKGDEKVKNFKKHYEKFIGEEIPNVLNNGFKRREVFTNKLIIEELFTNYQIILEKKMNEYSEIFRIENESKEKLSTESINKYKENRSKYRNEYHYEEYFVSRYSHSTQFKDLFWLDKKFESLDSEEQVLFLEKEFELEKDNAEKLKNNFFQNDESVFQMKIEALNNLENRLIRVSDMIIEKPKNQNDIGLQR